MHPVRRGFPGRVIFDHMSKAAWASDEYQAS